MRRRASSDHVADSLLYAAKAWENYAAAFKLKATERRERIDQFLTLWLKWFMGMNVSRPKAPYFGQLPPTHFNCRCIIAAPTAEDHDATL